MESNAPAYRYYRAMRGRWRGGYRLEITDWSGFRAAPMTSMDRLRLLLMHFLPKLLGPFTLTTTVDLPGLARGEVRHTTRTTKWGTPLFRSEETLQLDDDGRSLTMRGPQRLWPLLWPPRNFGAARGEINAGATGATYRIPWIGGEMVQRTQVVPEGLALSQENPWFQAAVTLRRIDAAELE
jgi:hypothetical protein